MSKTPIENVRLASAERLLAARRIRDHLATVRFYEAYTKATDDEAAEIVRLLEESAIDVRLENEVKAWTKAVLERDLPIEEWSDIRIREACRRHKIVGYGQMQPHQRVQALRDKGMND